MKNILFITKTILMRIVFAVAMMLWCSVAAYSQKMSVESFKLDETDLTANLAGTTVLDQNGEKCALIKIETTYSGFTFDVGNLGVTKVEEQNGKHPGEIWMYVPHGVKKLTIQHRILGTIKKHDLGISVDKAKTYTLKLTTNHVTTTVVDYGNRQYVVLSVFPANSDVYINATPVKLNEQGVAEMELPFGSHSYRISAKDYHPTEGQIIINDKDNKHRLDVVLKQAFGYISVKSPSSDFKDAEVYIDNVYAGHLPLNKMPIKSGMHKLRVSTKFYKPFEKDFAITDSAFVNLTPTFDPNYAEATISADDDDEVQLYDNDDLLGSGKWQGRLEAGEHLIEAKKKGHRSTQKTITVVAGQKINIDMPLPVPIYGSINVSTTPAGAEVYIDNKKCGVTPYVHNKIIIGEHKVEIKKPGYKPEEQTVVIEEGQTCVISRKLTDFCNASLYSNTAAKVYINKEYIGSTPYKLNLVAGKYLLELKASRYSTYSKYLQLDGATKDIHIKMHRNYVRKNEFYFNFGVTPLGMKSWNVGIGCYIYNFNLEGNYMGTMSKSEDIYITDGEMWPVKMNYSPSGGNFRMGYGIRCSSRIRITPQIGFQGISLKEKYSDELSFANGAYSFSGLVGTRFSFAFVSWLGISLTPEYMIPLYKSGGYRVLSAVSNDINGYCYGFNCNVNVNIFF